MAPVPSSIMRSLHIITASTSGNSEYVTDTVAALLREKMPEIAIELQRAELAGAADLLRGDIVILASGTWNTGGREGQLNPHMHELLMDRAKDVALLGKPLSFISLGDDRYYFRTRCTEHFLRFQRDHGGTLFLPPLILVNEPYGQEERILRWGEKLLAALQRAGTGGETGEM